MSAGAGRQLPGTPRAQRKGFHREQKTPEAPNPRDEVASDRPTAVFWLKPGRVPRPRDPTQPQG